MADTVKPLRLLIVLPSWVGDVVMATPTLRRIRRELPGTFIGALARPGMDQLLAGTDFVDEYHVERASGVMGPKFVAAKLRPRRYDAALLLTNSFSTALIVRIAGIPRRVGYDRDARGLLLTDKIDAPKRGVVEFAPISAVSYYWRLASFFLGSTPRVASGGVHAQLGLPAGVTMELVATAADEQLASDILAKGGVASGERYVILNPGGNNPAKRWPAERFARLADDLADLHNLTIVVNGSPAEAELVAQIAGLCKKARCVELPKLGITLGALKAVCRRAELMVTNDTGPRHIAAAFGVPVVSLFGPTDHRWTIIPTRADAPEVILTADPTLPESEVSNDHPERCAIEKISFERVWEACEGLLGAKARRHEGTQGAHV